MFLTDQSALTVLTDLHAFLQSETAVVALETVQVVFLSSQASHLLRLLEGDPTGGAGRPAELDEVLPAVETALAAVAGGGEGDGAGGAGEAGLVVGLVLSHHDEAGGGDVGLTGSTLDHCHDLSVWRPLLY